MSDIAPNKNDDRQRRYWKYISFVLVLCLIGGWIYRDSTASKAIRSTVVPTALKAYFFLYCKAFSALRHIEIALNEPRGRIVNKLDLKLLGKNKIVDLNEPYDGEDQEVETYGRLAQGISQREQCYHNLAQIQLAMEAYYKEHGEAVPLYTADENGRPLHSWRVLLLPYLGYRGLYEKIRLDEPWNSEWNRRFLTPELYYCPSLLKISRGDGYNMSCYSAVVERVADNDANDGYRALKTRDGTRIAIMERAPLYHWMDPTPEHELLKSVVSNEDYFSATDLYNHSDYSMWVLGETPFIISPEYACEHDFCKSPKTFCDELSNKASAP